MRVWDWLCDRGCGVFLHISSLPSKQGIGCFCEEAYYFVKFLKSSGMKYWQVCPMNPTSYGDSPYQSPSTFAGNPYFIDLHQLVENNLLTAENLSVLENLPRNYTDFGQLYEKFWKILNTAFERFLITGAEEEDFEEYCKTSESWLDDYALFMALKDKFNNHQWLEWPKEYANYDKAKVISNISAEIKKRALFHKFTQWIFENQWSKLKSFANKKGISIIGDVPIFVGMDSVDVWVNRSMFKLNSNGSPKFVAGVPPDAFSETGQLWGNPVYDWDALAKDNFRWWTKRMRRYTELYDITRIDHFRGFYDYWEVPADSATAKNGKWQKANGENFFNSLKNELPNIKLIAEDLGNLNKGSIDLLNFTGLPGMYVLHFAFDGGNRNKYLPHEHEKNSVLYLGTHDNDTTIGWFNSLSAETKNKIKSYMRSDCKDIAWDLIKKAYESTSNILILNMQDILNLGHEARFNTPNTASGNWQWRITAEQIKSLAELKTSEYLKHLSEIYGR